MPATEGVIGYGYALAIGNSASPIVYTDVAELKSIKPNLMTVPNVDATHLKSPNATEEYLPGLIKPGTVDFTGNLIGDATQLQIATLAQARTVFPFKIYGPIENINGVTSTYTLTGHGFFAKYEPGPFEPSKMAEFTAALQIAGNFTETVA